MRVKAALAFGKRHVLLIAAGAIALAIVGANIWFGLTAGDGLIMSNKRLLAGDFMAFWSAGRMTLEGAIADVHAARPIYEAQLRYAPGLDVVYLWHHPPTFLLVATGLARLPYLLAAAVFLFLTAALYALAARAYFASFAGVFFAFAAPAAAMHFGNVQTGLLTAALAGLALLWVDRRPLAAGALVGLFAIKPHLAVLFPLAFAAGGRRRAFAAAGAVTLLFCGLSVWAFGIDAWTRFFANMAHAQSMVTEQKIAPGTYATLFANLRGLGVAPLAAGIVHGISAVLAAAAVFVLWRRQAGLYAGAALAAASTLISPYLFFYDLTLFLVAAALIVRAAGGWDSLRLWEKGVVIYAWAAPGLLFSIGHYAPLPYAALAAWALILTAARRGLQPGAVTPAESAPGDPAPAPPR